MKENLIGFKNQKIINLENVSNIYVDDRGKKVIFNMNYSVKIFNDKFTPDYVYWQYESDEELNKITALVEANIVDWIIPVEKGQRYLNKACVSSITLDVAKMRAIFNLNYNKTHPKDDRKMTSDFVFYDFNDTSKFTDFVSFVTNQVKY